MASTSSEAWESANSCAHCEKDGKLVCNACHHAPDLHGGTVDTVWYWSPDCQIAHSQHEFACNVAQDRRSLYRAGATAQLAFYRYLEKFPDPIYTRVEKREEHLYLYTYEDGEDKAATLPFIWKACDNEEDKLTLLTLLMCGNSTGFVHVLMDIMLPGEYSTP